jgi:transposase
MVEQVTVGVDIGCRRHRVAIAAPDGRIAEEFDMEHGKEGFEKFFGRLSHYRESYQVPVVVAMEGFNGYARPLDQQVREKGYCLLNVNNLKLCRFKEIFPGAAKTDRIDARKIVELVRLHPVLSREKEILQEVREVPEGHQVLKRLTRRRRQLVQEKVCVLNRMQADLQGVSPGLADIVEYKDGLAFLRFLTCRPRLEQLGKIQERELLQIPGVGKAFAEKVRKWQRTSFFSQEVGFVGPMIQEDARRILELREQIEGLEKEIRRLSEESRLGQLVGSIPGFGVVCTGEIVGEIGTMERFPTERSLALYLGMAPLDNSSGNYRGTKVTKQVNRRGRAAMMAAVAHHARSVEESRHYYEKKREEGKTHNQAVRALGRHMVRVIWSMVKRNEPYRVVRMDESLNRELAGSRDLKI